MREIKFRAWDADDKRMCFQVYVGTEGWHGEYWTDGMMTSCFSDVNHKDNVLMQFTGLSDKSGKEIWEGDVVSYTYVNDYGATLKDLEDDIKNKVIREVVFKNGQFWPICMFNTDYHDFDDKDLIFIHFEVLGNIYENPELLERSK